MKRQIARFLRNCASAIDGPEQYTVVIPAPVIDARALSQAVARYTMLRANRR